MVIGNKPSSPSAGDSAIRDRFEQWGYSVTFIEDDDNQNKFDTAVESSRAVFISTSVLSTNVGTKLKSAAIGVVNAEGTLNDEMGIASGHALPIGDQVDIVDTSHYITSVFPQGTVRINRGSMEGLTTSGTEAPGAQRLAEWGGAGALVALDAGADLWNGGTAAGRRVMVPLGREGNIHKDYWTNSGALIVQRSLAWAMSADVVIGRRLLLVAKDATDLTDQEIAKMALIESWGFSISLIGEDDAQASFDAAMADADVVFVTQDVNSNDVNTKLTAATIGVVSEEAYLADELGFSDGINLASGTDLTIDNDYFVTVAVAIRPGIRP